MRPVASSSFPQLHGLDVLGGRPDGLRLARPVARWPRTWGPKGTPRSTISSGNGLTEGSVDALQDLAGLPVLPAVGQGVVGLAAGGVGGVVPLHGADGSALVAAVVPDVIVGVHEDNCTRGTLDVNH